MAKVEDLFEQMLKGRLNAKSRFDQFLFKFLSFEIMTTISKQHQNVRKCQIVGEEKNWEQ